jgi:hypothetical protein
MTDTHASAARNARGRFQPGASGNPAGKKPGTLNHATRFKHLLDDGDFETAARHIIERAREGNFAAARFLLDRLDPKPRGRAITLDLPEGSSPERFAALTRAMCRGEVTPDEAKTIAAVLEAEDKARERVVAAKVAATKRNAVRASNWLAFEMARPQFEKRLGSKIPMRPLVTEDESGAEVELAPDLHSTSISESSDAAEVAAPPPSIPSTQAGTGREGPSTAPHLHPASISPPAPTLPTPRRRAMNRLRAAQSM